MRRKERKLIPLGLYTKFEIVGYAMNELMSEKSMYGLQTYYLIVRSIINEKEYSYHKVYFFELNAYMKNINFKNRKVKIVGYIRGSRNKYSRVNNNTNILTAQEIYVLEDDGKQINNLETTVISENDLP